MQKPGQDNPADEAVIPKWFIPLLADLCLVFVWQRVDWSGIRYTLLAT